MKTINKLFLVTLIGGLFTLAACSDEIVREPSPIPTEGVQAYIYADATSLSFLPDDKQSFLLNVVRQNTAAAATVHLTAEGEGFTAPETVNFAAGEGEKKVEITFDLAIGASASVNISIPEEEAYVYGTSQMAFKVSRDYTWQDLGTWTLQTSFYGIEGTTQVFKAVEADLYKAIEPYDKGYNLLFKVDGNKVTVEKQAIVASYGTYGVLYVQGNGTLENNVITVALKFTVAAGSFGEYVETFGLFTQN